MKKQLLNVIMITLGFALAANRYTNRLNPGLVRGLTWLLSGIGKRVK